MAFCGRGLGFYLSGSQHAHYLYNTFPMSPMALVNNSQLQQMSIQYDVTHSVTGWSLHCGLQRCSMSVNMHTPKM